MKSLMSILAFSFGAVTCGAFLGGYSSQVIIPLAVIWNIWLAALAVTGRMEELKK